MRITARLPAVPAAILLSALLAAPAAAALLNKSYVSNSGDDTHTCADPTANACASFNRAIAVTEAGGEITVVNTGEYGDFIAIHAINVTNDGAGEASIVNLGAGIGIEINAGAGDVVSVRGLVIDGQGTGVVGITVNTASAVHIQNCVIRNFEASPTSYGILMQPTGHTQLFVSDTIIFNNGNNFESAGILLEPFGTGTANVVLDRVHVENNVIGILANGDQSTGTGIHAVIRDSVVSGNASFGIQASTVTGKAPAFIVVERASVVNNANSGIRALGPGATMLLKDNTVSRNGAGLDAESSGQLISYGNNRVNNNIGPDGTPTGSYSPI